MSIPAKMDQVDTIDNSPMRSVKTTPDQYLPTETSGLQQLEHLEKELEQAKQKVSKRSHKLLKCKSAVSSSLGEAIKKHEFA